MGYQTVICIVEYHTLTQTLLIVNSNITPQEQECLAKKV